MLFNSWGFLLFLGLVFLGHFGVAPRFKNRGLVQVCLLVSASILFYGYDNPKLVFLLSGSFLLNGIATRFLLSPGRSPQARRTVCFLAVAGNLAGIGFFKYAGLIAGTLLPGTAFAAAAPWLASIPLPLGISFYTFEGLSLVVDAWQERREGFDSLRADLDGRPASFFGKVALFMTFFPHLVAGPIVRAHDFIGQIGGKAMGDIDWYYVVRKLTLGFFLKMVVADNLKEATVTLSFPNFLEASKPDLILLLYGYSFQIFADFCGYSLIAMGLAALFGYRFPINFNLPYLSMSITEFWKRWHISLSSWLRDYLYIPLGGNRRGRGRSYFNLFLVMFLGGLWHGAAWSYAIWGGAHGLCLAFERLFRDRAGTEKCRPSSLPVALLQTFVVFNLVSLLWLLFKLPHFADVIAYGKTMIHAGWKPQPRMTFVLFLFSLPVVLFHLWGAGRKDEGGRMREKMEGMETIRMSSPDGSGPGGGDSNFRIHFENTLLGVMLFLILVNSGTAGTFIYFQF
jgi:alginate O-acetyltransferase complex protein AlgI